jgi:hypothetical protein
MCEEEDSDSDVMKRGPKSVLVNLVHTKHGSVRRAVKAWMASHDIDEEAASLLAGQ